MRFLVVACPSCRRVQAAEARFRAAACRGCRATIEPAKLRTFYRGDDEGEARAVVQRVSAQLSGMGIEELSGVLERVERDRAGTVEDLLADLARRAEFDAAEFEHAVRALRVPGDSAKLLGRLVGENRLYEPRPGRFRIL